MEKCYRCNSNLINVTTSDADDVEFFECTSCKSSYSKRTDGNLHDRWLMPITLPLYSVIFDKNPETRAREQAHEFLNTDNIDIEILKTHIREELESPKQNISEILNFKYPNEDKLRKYLRCFVTEIEGLQKNV